MDYIVIVACIFFGVVLPRILVAVVSTWASCWAGIRMCAPILVDVLRFVLGSIFYPFQYLSNLFVLRFVRDPLLEEVVSPPTEIADGKLILQGGVFYYEVKRPNGTLLVRVGPEALFFQQKQGEDFERRESYMPGSKPIQVSDLPKGQVALRSGGDIVGYGCRCVLGGKEGLLTAAHVLLDLKKSADRSIGTSKFSYPLGDWELLLYSVKADIAFVAIPANVWARLGVAKAQVGRLPSANSPVSVTWNGTEGTFVHRGVVVSKKLFFSHTASTTFGSSGAPVFAGNKVVGVHIRGGLDHNIAVALNPFLGGNESDVRDDSLKETDHLETGEDFVVTVGNTKKTLRASAQFYSYIKDVEFKLSKGGTRKTWWEMEEDEDLGSVPDQESGLNRATEQVFRERRVPALQPTLDATAGIPQKEKKKSRRKRRSASKKSAVPEPQSVVEVGGKIESQNGSTSGCPPSVNGGGRLRTQGQSEILFGTIPASSVKESGLGAHTGNESSPPTVQLTLRSGRIPKIIRDYLNSLDLGLKCGKNRMWLLPKEVSHLEKQESSELVEMALRFRKPT
uniref:Peptidase n=1 Tax=Apple barna-like virus 1 TaxID=2709742 RepID=A0A6C0X222_9VIRU|nr:MAG: peptidase [Apple barna-like virus 1]